MNHFFTKLIVCCCLILGFSAQQAQAQCMADAGTTSTAGFPAELCAGEVLNLSTAGAVNVNPPFATNPCMVWGMWVIDDPLLVYSGLSGLGLPPSGGLPKDDPNFAKFLSDFGVTIAGTNVSVPAQADGATYWIAPITAADCTIEPPFIDPNCYEVGDPVQVYFNPEITLIQSAFDCDDITAPTTQVNIQLGGGQSASLGTPFTLTNNGVGTLSTTVVGVGESFTVSGIPDGGTVNFTVMDGAGCSRTFTLGPVDASEHCPLCGADAGDINIFQQGDGLTKLNNGLNSSGPFILCWEDEITFGAFNNGVPPTPAPCGPPGCTGSCTGPGFSWIAHIDQPVGANPFDPTTSMGWGFSDDYSSGAWAVVNNNSHFNTITGNIVVPGAVTNTPVNNTVWYLLSTMDYRCCPGGGICFIDFDRDNDGCFDLSVPVSVTYLKEIFITETQNCFGVSVTFDGGFPEFFPGVYNVTLATPTYGTLSSPSAGHLESILISDLNVGDSYTITVTDSNGCRFVFNGTYTGTPVTPVIPQSGPYCDTEGPSIITGTPSSPLSSYSGTGVTDNLDGTASFDPIVAGVGTHTIFYTYYDPISDCTYQADPIDVTVQPGPSMDISGSGAGCSGNLPPISISFTNASPPYTYTLAIDGVPQAPMLTFNNPHIFTPTQAGTYTLVTASDASCDGLVSGSALITQLPDPASQAHFTSLCDDAQDGVELFILELNNSFIDVLGGNTVSYHFSQTDAENNAFPLFSPYLATNNTTLYARVEDASGCFSVAELTLGLTDPPLVELGLDITECINSGTILVDATTPGASYLWSAVPDDGNNGSTDPAIFVDDSTPNPGTVYTVTVTDDFTGCSASDVITVTLTDETVPTLPSLSDMCSTDAAITLDTDLGGITGTWSGDGISGAMFDPNGLDGTITLTFTPDAGAQCAAAGTTDVLVNAVATPALTALNDMCSTDAAVALATTQDGIDGTWSGTGVAGNTFDPAGLNGTITLTFTPDAGACANSNTTSLDVNEATPPVLDNINDRCQLDGAIALATTQDGINGTWSGTGVSGNMFDPAGLNGSVTLTFTPDAGECALVNTTPVNVIPAVTPNLTALAAICQSASAIALSTTQDGINGTWSGTGVSGNSFDPAGLNGNITLTFTPSAGQCANLNTTSITVDAAVTPALDAFNAVCALDNTVNLPTTQDGINGTWSGTGVSGNMFDPAGLSGNITLTFTPSVGECANSNTTSIDVAAAVTPVLDAIGTQCQLGNVVNLPTVQNGINGSWSGMGVTGNSFNPAGLSGNITLTFTPNGGECANTNTTNVAVDAAITPALTAIPNQCASNAPVNLPTTQDGVTGSWSGTGVSGNSFDPSGLNGNITLTFTPAAGACANDNTTTVNVAAAVTPALDNFPAQCASNTPINLPTTQDGINGSWSGTGVSGNSFDPSGLNGNIPLTFTPAAGACANTNTTSILVDAAVTPALDNINDLCQTDMAINLATTQDGIVGTWSGNGVTGNSFDPNGLSGNITLTFTPNAGQCALDNTTTVDVAAANAPALDAIADLCQLDVAVNLPATQDGISGTWSGPGVNGNQFNPAGLNGNITLTFTPSAGECALDGTTDILVNPATNPVLDNFGAICEQDAPLNLPTTQDGINGTWSGPGVTGNSFDPSTASLGLVTITFTPNAGQCANDNTTNITVNDAVVPALDALTDLCEDATSINLPTTQDGVNGTWSGTGVTGNVFDPTGQSGAIVLTFTPDAGQCAQSNTTGLSVNVGPMVNVLGDTDLCVGQSIASLDAGAGFSNYLWSNNTANQTIDVSAGGLYTVTVTDANGCTGVGDIDVTANTAVVPNIMGDPDFCQGSNSMLDAGPGYVSYEWSGLASTGQTATATASGTYTVTVTDANGCTAENAFTVVENTNPTVVIGGSTTYCPGSNTILDAGAGFSNYEWSNNTSGQDISVNQEGTFSVTVTDVNGCTGVASVMVTESSSLAINITGDDTYCAGENTMLDAGAGFTSYLWSDNSVGQTLEVNTPGNYSVTVTDAGGCTGEDLIQVVENAPPSIDIAGDDNICENGQTVLDAGAGFTNYLWSDNTVNAQLTVNTGGMYSVTVTDANGCTAEDVFMVTENTNPQPNIDGILSFCDGDMTNLDAGSYSTYLWSDNSTDQNLMVDATGTYSVTVTDANGCTGIDQVTVTEEALPSPDILGELTFCFGENTTLDVGNSFANVLWSDNSNGTTLVVNATADYSVTVTDANGCTGVDLVSVTEVPELNPDISGSLTFCLNSSTVLNAGDGFSNYEWSNNTSGQTINVGTPGMYSVTVTDANGCTGIDQVMVEQSAELQPDILGDLAFCNGGMTTLDAGDGFSTYLWSNNTVGQTLDISTPGSYSVTVTDASGCSGQDLVIVEQSPDPIPAISGSTTFCTGSFSVLDAGDFVSYVWSNNETSQTIDAGVAGMYSVTVTDVNGCTGVDQVVIDEAAALMPIIAGDDQFCNGGSTLLDVGTGFTTYLWSDNSAGSSLNVDASGVYSVTVTDASGCSGTADIAVTELDLVNPDIDGLLSFCVGTSTTLDAGAYDDYLWSDNSVGQTLNVSAPGNYSVTVTDVNGCTGVDMVMVEETDGLMPAIDGALDFCNAGNTELDAGTGYDTYLWSNNTNGQMLVVDAPGTYSVTVS
ncbi:MAG: hypothetical protein AAGD05_00300, partial [Bacteroidota bacterium]